MGEGEKPLGLRAGLLQKVLRHQLPGAQKGHQILVVEIGEQLTDSGLLLRAVHLFIVEPAQKLLRRVQVLRRPEVSVDLDDQLLEVGLPVVNEQDGEVLGVGVAEYRVVEGQTKHF